MPGFKNLEQSLQGCSRLVHHYISGDLTQLVEAKLSSRRVPDALYKSLVSRSSDEVLQFLKTKPKDKAWCPLRRQLFETHVMHRLKHGGGFTCEVKLDCRLASRTRGKSSSWLFVTVLFQHLLQARASITGQSMKLLLRVQAAVLII